MSRRQVIPYRRNVRRGETLTPVGVALLAIGAALLLGILAFEATR